MRGIGQHISLVSARLPTAEFLHDQDPELPKGRPAISFCFGISESRNGKSSFLPRPDAGPFGICVRPTLNLVVAQSEGYRGPI
jgi:hypothetical protein